MKKIATVSCLAFLLTAISKQGNSQTSLYVSAGANFYIGSGTVVSIDGFVIKPSAGYTVKGPNSVTRNTTAAPPPPATYLQRVYQLLQTTNGFSGDISFYYQDAELNGLDENTLTLKIYDGSAWNTYVPATRDAVNNFVTASALSGIAINQATLAAPSSALPVTLSRFWSEEKNCIALLKWSTATEQNSKEFQVQQGSDGVGFSTIGVVPAAGYSFIVKNYQLSVPLVSPLSYFRLRMVDKDGGSKYSDIIKITAPCASNIITVHPNPTVQTIIVKGLSGSSRLVLRNQAGQQVSAIITANTTAEFDVSKLPAGSYVVQVIKEGQTIESVKLIKN